jgi:hypothetical protein
MTKFLRELDDPEIDKKKINYRDYFELVIMRHMYFRRSENPAPGRLEQFEEMVVKISNKIYFRNIETFKTVGMEPEDLQNIARVHTVSFISMDGLYENPDKMEKFTEKHKKIFGKDSNPKKSDVFKQECYNLKMFLNQRLQEVAKVSKSKNSNIRGTRSYKKYFIGDGSKNPSDMELINNFSAYGYKRMKGIDYEKSVKENNSRGKLSYIDKDGNTIRVVYVKGSFLTQEDINGKDIDVTRGSFYRTPEDNFLIKESVTHKKK